MTVSSEIQPSEPEWITLPQALCWIEDKTEPDLAGMPGTLPSFRKDDPPCEKLYRYWTQNKLELYGMPGRDAILRDGETTEIVCHEFGDFRRVPRGLIERGGIKSIKWEFSFLYKKIRNDEECRDEILYYWANLRVRWSDLLKLVPKEESSEVKQTESLDSSVHLRSEEPATDEKRVRRPKRKDWPTMAALTAFVWEREPKKRGTDKGTWERVGKLLDQAKYSCPPFLRVPKRDEFIRYAIVSVEIARKMLGKENSTKKRTRWRGTRPEDLFLASALAATLSICEDEPQEALSKSNEYDRIARMLESSGYLGSGTGSNSRHLDFIDEALEAVESARALHDWG